MNPENQTRTGRAGLLTVAMAATPVLLALGSVLAGPVIDSRADTVPATAAQLQLVAAHRAQTFTAFLVHVIAGLVMIPAVIGLMRLAGARGAALATPGGLMSGLGGGLIAVNSAMFGLTMYFAAAPGLDRAAMTDYVFTMKRDVGAYVLVVPSLLVPVGVIVLAGALLRSRTVPRWQAGLLFVGIVLGFLSPSGAIAAIWHLPLITAFTVLALQLRGRTSSERWPAAPEAVPDARPA
jgi:hypothetical protein